MRLRLGPGRSATAFRVAARNRSLRLVQLARLASVTGRWAYTIALAVFAYRSGGTGGVALAGIVRLAPAALGAPFTGALIGRARVDRVLLAGGLLRSLALTGAGVVVLGGGRSPAVFALVAVESAVSTLMRPVQNSLLPELARTPEELTSANLALSVIESAGVFLGPLAGAALLHGTGVGVVFIAASAAYLASTALLLPVDTPSSRRVAGARAPGVLAEVAAGARAVVRDRDTAVVVLLYGAQNLVAGALNVLIVVIALRLLALGQSGVGALTAAVGIGGVCGGGLVFARLRRRRYGIDLGIGLLLWGIPLVVLSVFSSRLSAFVLLAIVGVGVTVVDVAAVTLIQRTAARDSLAHTLGLLQAVFVVTVAAGTLLAPVLVAALGLRGTLLVTGVLLPVLAGAVWHRLRDLDAHGSVASAHVALLVAIPIFTPLADAAIEHLASTLRLFEIPGGEAVFEQGDAGDAFYVVEAGEVDVSIDGRRVRRLGPGESFGEIALLRDVPRTATVRATRDTRLLSLARGPFLATVTGNSASSEAADAVVVGRLGLRAGFTTL